MATKDYTTQGGPNLKYDRTHEALNIESAAGWSVHSIITLGKGTGDGDTVHVQLATGTRTILLQPGGACMISFTLAATDLDFTAKEDYKLMGNGATEPDGTYSYEIKVPKGLVTDRTSPGIVLNILDISGAAGGQKVILVEC